MSTTAAAGCRVVCPSQLNKAGLAAAGLGLLAFEWKFTSPLGQLLRIVNAMHKHCKTQSESSSQVAIDTFIEKLFLKNVADKKKHD
ncbi:MAG: hypothetical protein WCS42_19020 [Verrucomicrobiota bacterium]